MADLMDASCLVKLAWRNASFLLYSRILVEISIIENAPQIKLKLIRPRRKYYGS